MNFFSDNKQEKRLLIFLKNAFTKQTMFDINNLYRLTVNLPNTYKTRIFKLKIRIRFKVCVDFLSNLN